MRSRNRDLTNWSKNSVFRRDFRRLMWTVSHRTKKASYGLQLMTASTVLTATHFKPLNSIATIRVFFTTILFNASSMMRMEIFGFHHDKECTTSIFPRRNSFLIWILLARTVMMSATLPKVEIKKFGWPGTGVALLHSTKKQNTIQLSTTATLLLWQAPLLLLCMKTVMDYFGLARKTKVWMYLK